MSEQNESDAQLRRLGRYWQRRLGLPHWSITYTFEELVEGGLGFSRWDPHTQEATVKISPTLNLERYKDRGVEATLIHELLHIVWQGHMTEEEIEEPLNTLIEVAINRIADALCRTKVRRGKKA